MLETRANVLPKAVIAGAILAGIAFAPSASNAQGVGDFSFSRIADANTPVPGDTGTFNRFGIPWISSGNVVFSGGPGPSDEQSTGVYTNLGGTLRASEPRAGGASVP